MRKRAKMNKNEIRKVIMSILLTIIPAISTSFLLRIMTVQVTIMIFVLIVVILNFIRYRVDKFYDIPVYIRKFKKLIHSNKDYNRITNVDNILDFFKKDEVNSFFKLIFPIITREVNPNSTIHYLGLQNKRFYEFLIYNYKLSLVKLINNEFVSAKEYRNRQNAIVDKKRLKLFFKDLINKSKNPGTDYTDQAIEKNDPHRDIGNMIGDMPFI